jgi:ribosomal protein L37AE/L43A
MIGRGMRLHEGKEDCYVLDQSGNVKRFGFLEDMIHPPLKKLDKEKKESENEAPVKECPQCHHLVHARIMECPHCGYIWEKKGKGDGFECELKIILKPAQKPVYRYYREKIKELYQQGKNPCLALFQTKDFFRDKSLTGLPLGSIPLFIPKEWAKGAIFGDKPTIEQKHEYFKFLMQLAQQQGNKDQSWVLNTYTLEFGTAFLPAL